MKEKLDKLKNVSGNISSNDKLVGFLYDLMRDHLPAGVVEELVQNSEDAKRIEFTNGFLANYAKNLADRLK